MDHFNFATQFNSNALWFARHIFGEKRINHLLNDYIDSHRKSIIKQLQKGHFDFSIQEIGPRETSAFIPEFRDKGSPVIIRGAAQSWGCVKKWTPDFFADKYGQYEQFKIDKSGAQILAEKNSGATQEVTSIGEVVAKIKEGSSEYANFNPLIHYCPELHDDLEVNWIFKLMHKFGYSKMYQLFMGGQNSGTDLHCAISDNLFVQVYGEKEWYILPPAMSAALHIPATREPCFHSHIDFKNPDYERFPVLKHIKPYRIVLHPGDVFYNPPFYWHQVTNLTNSIGVAYKWNYAPSSIRQSLVMSLLTILATNPPVWKVMGNQGEYLNVFAHKRTKEVPI